MVTYQDVLKYLNEQMPDIGGIFPAPVKSDEEDSSDTTVVEDSVTTGLTPEQLALLQAGQEQRGGGAFGNLDMSSAKDFYVDGEVVPGYRNINTGLYQDIDGLNIQNLGIKNVPGLSSIFQKFAGNQPSKYPGYFDTYNATDLFTEPKSFFDFYRQPTPQEIVQQRGLAKKTMAEAKAITERLKEQASDRPGGAGQGDRSREQAGPGFEGSGTAAEMGSF